ncbi:uncharacterized protein LOC125659827 isoform X4 [Ostrea edulis]|uniref:uncharacterized protein LOC125659827 isoform X4 n=1 Tax=Ostrea edulis TaxID=37623 RepID=UPI0024AF9280|nr:uncharacterized protein LOC125659827 isoform X4 [Ostrea edulis]
MGCISTKTVISDDTDDLNIPDVHSQPSRYHLHTLDVPRQQRYHLNTPDVPRQQKCVLEFQDTLNPCSDGSLLSTLAPSDTLSQCSGGSLLSVFESQDTLSQCSDGVLRRTLAPSDTLSQCSGGSLLILKLPGTSLETEPVFEKEEILPEFYTWLNDKYKDIKVVRLYIGKQDLGQNGSTKDVIVLVLDGFSVIKEDAYEHRRITFPIICKLWKFLPVEELISSPDPFSNSEFPTKVELCIQSISKSLFKEHSNLESISASFYRLKDIGEEKKRLPELCIVLYCSCKGVVPLHEQEFPKIIKGIKTDVREGFFHLFGIDDFFKRSTDVLNPLMMGASISKKDDNNGGTLGGFVTLENGDIGFITCAHVFFDLSGQCDPSAKFDIVQPSYGYLNTNTVCGTHARSCFPTSQSDINACTIDAALVKLTDRVPERGLFADLTVDNLKENGYSIDNLPEYSTADIRDSEEAGRLMLPCVKWGAKTGFTRGMLRLAGTAVRWTNESINLGNPSSQCSFIFNKQLEIQGIGGTSFALPGDSGALVFQLDPAKKENEDHQLHCIGMVVGGISAGKTIVTPIRPILEALNVKLHKFSQEKMDDS